MMHRFSQLVSRPIRRQFVDGVVERVGSASRETLGLHDGASPRHVKEKQRTCSQVNKTSGDVSRTESVTAAVTDRTPAGEYGVAEESCVHSNANNAYAGGWATTSVTESRNGNDDVNFFADKWPSNIDLESDTTTGQEDIGVVGVNSFGGESSDELCHANLYRWPSVDLAYDADIDEMPCADEQTTTACPVKDFSQTVSRGHAESGPDTDETYSVEEKPSVDLVGANVVGANVVGANAAGANAAGANVVGADVVGDKRRGASAVPRSDRESSAHPNANNANLERWETPYNSDTDPWEDDSVYDGPEANVDLDSNSIDQEVGAMAAVTSVGEEPPRSNQVNPSTLLVLDLEYAGEIPCAYDGQTTVLSIGVSDVVDIRYVPGLKSGGDVDTVGENPGGVDAISRESELTSVSQVSADQYSANDDWGPAFASDHEPWQDIDESELALQGARISASGVSFGKQSSVQANAVGVNERQPSVQSNIVSVNDRPCVHPNVVGVNAKPYAPSYVFSFDELPSDQSRAATPHTYTTVFISDAETDNYEDVAAADAVPTSSTSAVNEHPDDCSRFAANIDAEEKVDPVETVDPTTTTVKESSAVGGGDLPDVNVEKIQSERVRVGAALVGAAADDWALPVVDDDPVTWVKSGDDFDWDDASSDLDTEPPYRLVCGCFPKRRRRLTIQLRRYRVKRVAKRKKKKDEEEEEEEKVRTEQEPKDENFVEIKCPRGQTSFKGFFRSR